MNNDKSPRLQSLSPVGRFITVYRVAKSPGFKLPGGLATRAARSRPKARQGRN
jgi:hypothetical protein